MPTANLTSETQIIVLPRAVSSRFRKGDADADTFALSQHNAGNTDDEIAKQLIRRGYAVTRAEVVGSLYRQGMQNARLGPISARQYPWNALADAFTLAGSNAQKSVSEIRAGLTAQGYNVTEAEVRASLAKQGIWPHN